MYYLRTIVKKCLSIRIGTAVVQLLLVTFILLITGQNLFGQGSGNAKATEFTQNISISKGGNVAIDLAALCKNANNDCDIKTIVIHFSPSEGAVIKRRDGLYVYQHGGVSTADDIFRVIYDTEVDNEDGAFDCLLYTSPSPRDKRQSRMPSSA